MAERYEAKKQYSYGQSANLVISTGTKRETVPDSEVRSLAGQLSMDKMGDRALREKPNAERIDRLKRKRTDKEKEKHQVVGRSKTDTSVLSAEVDAMYRPKTQMTQRAYDVLLNIIEGEMGGQRHDVLKSAADEVLSIMKDEAIQGDAKRSEVQAILSVASRKKLNDEKFSRIFNVCNKITDFSDDKATGAAGDDNDLDQDIGVAVDFDEGSDDAESDTDMLRVDDDGNDSEGDDQVQMHDEERNAREDARRQSATGQLHVGDDTDAIDLVEASAEIDLKTIDAHWVQRQLSQFYDDAHECQSKADEILGYLGNQDSRDVENRLMEDLGYEKSDFAFRLLRNRLEVFWCTKLARAENDAERNSIEDEMQSSGKLRDILAELQSTKGTMEARTKEVEARVMREARNLRASNQNADQMEVEVEAADVVHDEDSAWSKSKAKMTLDLESLAFRQGGHFMSNTKWKLPKDSWRQDKKGYQEIFVPSIKAHDVKPGECMPIKDLPEWVHPAFSRPSSDDPSKLTLMKELNRVQTKVYPCAFLQADNMLLCAPTGAGKTNCAMLTILREIGLHRNAKTGVIDVAKFKIVYVAPMKSLVREMVANFGKRLKPFGINVAELSGDQQLSKQQIADTQLIVTTPEKWDIVTRKSGDRTYTQLVRLVIFDEIHLLHDGRGPVLEAIIARCIRQTEQTQELIRLVGLSATLPNYEDVARFLRVDPKKSLFFFDNSYRPCPLQQRYIGITVKKAFKQYQMMNDICYERVLEQAGKNQSLVFVHSRKETANAAKFFKDRAIDEEVVEKFQGEESTREILRSEAEGVKDQKLKELLPYGFAIHHAGMPKEDRALVEDLFADGHIQVLVSTATLAWGVNLPAHTVIIKGTQVYDPEKGRWTELSMLDVMQMLGRAGRPQYDTYGEGIIITSHSELKYYMSLLNEQLPVESQMIKCLADNLNAEIVMGTVRNIKEAVQWLGYTYLYVRMLHAPELYGCAPGAIDEDPQLEQRRVDLAHTAAGILDKAKLIRYDKRSGNFQVTDLGRVSSYYYISHTSMQTFHENMKPTMSEIEIFRVFSLSQEFKNITVREEEKLELAKLLDKVPIPVKESIEEPSAKVNVLLQAFISRLRLDGFALVSDMIYVTQSAGRLMRALFEIAVKRGWALVAEKLLSLCLSIDHRMWSIESPLRQFRGAIAPDIIRKIEKKEFPWERFHDLNPQEIGELIRFPKMGRPVHKLVHFVPKLELTGHVQPITRTVLRVELTIQADFEWEDRWHRGAQPFWIMVTDVDGESILHHEYFTLKRKFVDEEHTVTFTIPIYDPLPPQYYIKVVSDKWLGSETTLPISFRHLLLPEKYPPPTELLDLQPLPVDALGDDDYTQLYRAANIEYFNPIQTQCFNALFKTDDAVLIAAPAGSGKIVCAEFALIRMLEQFPNGRAVYIAPVEALANLRYRDWQKKFGKKLQVPVVQLTGETTTDLKLLAQGQIIVTTPDRWDIMSRRWKTRKNVQNVNLVICDELHLIGGKDGPTYETVVSRMRYIASQTENPIRLVGLSASVANARDLGEWIGASPKAMFSFHPQVRPTALEIFIQGFDINHFASRQLAMVKPTFLAITGRARNKPVVVVVPSRKLARSTAADLMMLAAAAGGSSTDTDDSDRFLHVDLADIHDYLDKVTDKTLKACLAAGIGFYHGRLTAVEKDVVYKLFKAEAIQVVVVDHTQCWGLDLQAHMVVVAGTTFFDGAEHRYVDYPLTDVIQMMGMAGRTDEQSAKAVVFCHAPKKDYLKKFLFEPFPVESHLDHELADHVNAEIVTQTIENVQDCVDYITWTFLYRRLTQNPNYYNLQGVSHRHLSDHLSEMVEQTLEDLEQARCIAMDDDSDLSALNLGMIAAYYYIKYTTVELFSKSLTSRRKLKGILEIVCNASEYEALPVRRHEDVALKKLAMHLPLKIDKPKWTDPHTKANVLFQAHFSRTPLSADVAGDRDTVLKDALRLLQACVDVISSNGWLEPALAAMELSQMITQGLWDSDSFLLQLPHITRNVAAQAKKQGVDTVFDLLDMEDDDRNALLKVDQSQLVDIARVANDYPNVDVSYQVQDKDEIHQGQQIRVNVTLERDADDVDSDDDEEMDDEQEDKTKQAIPVPKVYAPRFPDTKTEGWWLVIGSKKDNQLLSIKRVAMKRMKMTVPIEFVAPKQGTKDLMLYLMSDSYLGCDQEYDFQLEIGEPLEDESSSEDESSEEEDAE